MKVRTLVETESAESVDAAGKYLPRPAGLEIEHPDAWRLCLLRDDKKRLIAEPLDDEATAAIAAFKRTPIVKPTPAAPAESA